EAQVAVEAALFELGVSGAEVRRLLQNPAFRGLVKANDPSKGQTALLQAPLDKYLQPGDTYTFRLESAAFVDVAVVSGGRWHFLKRQGNVFQGTVPAQKGTLTVSGKLPG